jgi:S-adenosylmethionine uptake transporter
MTRQHPAMPLLAALTGIALFAIMDATMKRASLAGGVYNALLFRSLTGTVLLFPLWQMGGGRWPARPVLRLHATRSLVVAAMALLYFWGLMRLPLAEAIAISFIAPLIALYLAAVLLHERIGRWAIAGSLLGLAGVVVISAGHIGQGGITRTAQAPGIAAVLCSAVLYGWNLILQRQQAQLASPREVAFFQNLLVGLILLTAAPWLAHRPSPDALGLIGGAAVLTATSLMLLSWAYARSEAQLLLPTEYSAFVWAALAGWLWFGERLDAATVLGGALIVAGCLAAARGTPAQHAELTVV